MINLRLDPWDRGLHARLIGYALAEGMPIEGHGVRINEEE